MCYPQRVMYGDSEVQNIMTGNYNNKLKKNTIANGNTMANHNHIIFYWKK